MNVTDQEFKEYIEVFHSTLETTAKEYLPPGLLDKLLHLSLLPARIIGYISTQYGVAIEYEREDKTLIEIKRGSARVEDLLIRAPKNLRDIGPMLRISGRDSGIFNLTLSGAFPFRLDGADASFSIGDVGFEAEGWNRTVTYAEVFGNRSKSNWLKEKAVSRAKDEVLAALVEHKHAEIRNLSIFEYIASFKKNTVLILGDYDDEGIKRLTMIADILSKLGYEPLLLKDVPDHPYHDLSQKLVAVGAIARFIVVDDSSKSGHLSEVEICKQNRWVTILMHSEGKRGLG